MKKLHIRISILSMLCIVHGTSAINELGRIWPLGDSITYGAGGTAGGYRDPLYTNLVARGCSFTFVGTTTGNSSTLLTNAGQNHHDGHSAYAIADFAYTNNIGTPYNYNGLHDEVAGWYGSLASKPDTILLLIGINDLNQRYDEAGAPGRLDDLISLLFSIDSNFRILISSLTNADSNNKYRHNPPNNDLSVEIEAYNAAMAAMVATRRALGQDIEFVDMHAVLTPADLTDGLHPNAGGYKKMANIWADALLPDPPHFTTNAIDASGSTVTLEAAGALGTSYSLWSASELSTNTEWALMNSGSIAVNPFTIQDAATNSQRFYRFSAP